jgi:hypothetical protein
VSEPSHGRRPSDFQGRHESIASITTLRTVRANSSAGKALPQRRQSDADILEVSEASEGDSANSMGAKKTAQLTPVVSTEKGITSEVSWWDKLSWSRKKTDEHNHV